MTIRGLIGTWPENLRDTHLGVIMFVETNNAERWHEPSDAARMAGVGLFL
jgi:hypothetical protein